LRLNPSCSDARYQQTVCLFYTAQNKRAVAALTKLVQEHRDLFVRALIDPQLAPFIHLVQPRLRRLFNEVKQAALEAVPKAEADMKRLQSLCGDQDTQDQEIGSIWEKINTLLPSEGYYSYLDIAQLSNLISYQCLNNISGWKKRINRGLAELEMRCSQCVAFIKHYPYPALTGSPRNQLRGVRKELDHIRNTVDTEKVDEFKAAYDKLDMLSKKTDEMLLRIRRLAALQKTVYFLSTFLKTTITLQSINLAIGIILLPVIFHYITVVFPELKTIKQNVWVYQKGYLFSGGVFAVLLAALRPLKRLSRQSPRPPVFRRG